MLWFIGFGCLLFESARLDALFNNQQDTGVNHPCEESSCQDFDQDGYLGEEDCDDHDDSLLAIAQDLDCDGQFNEVDSCPEDPFDDLDQDGICGDQDPECNMNFAVQQISLEEDLKQIASCSTIEGDIYIYDLEEERLPIFEELEVLRGSILIGENEELQTIDAFPSLITMIGILRIQDNPKLEVLTGFGKLSHVERVEVFNHPNLCVSGLIQFLEDLNYPDSEQAGNNSDC